MTRRIAASCAVVLSALLWASGSIAQDTAAPVEPTTTVSDEVTPAPTPLDPDAITDVENQVETPAPPASEASAPLAEEGAPVAGPKETPTTGLPLPPVDPPATAPPTTEAPESVAPTPEPSWQSMVVPYVSIGAGVVFTILGLGLLGAGGYPAVLQYQVQSELKALEDAGGGAANLEQARQLQTQSYDHEKNFQQFGAPLMAAGLALTVGGVAIAAGGGYLVAQSFMEE